MSFQNNLLRAISILPNEIQDLINEYNVNHRPLMRKVLNELTQYGNTRCLCNKIITCNDEFQYEGLYIYPWKKYIYCSSECAEAGDSGVLKARYRWLKRLNNIKYNFNN